MFTPYELCVGLRYTRAKRRNHFISFISLTSMIGIALGATALITVISVMNGFERELRERILGVASHATISGFDRPLEDWESLAAQAEAHPEGGGGRSVRGVAGHADPRWAGPGRADPRCFPCARAAGLGGRAVPGRRQAGEPCPRRVQRADRARFSPLRLGATAARSGDARRPPGADHPGRGAAPHAPLHRHRHLRGPATRSTTHRSRSFTSRTRSACSASVGESAGCA